MAKPRRLHKVIAVGNHADRDRVLDKASSFGIAIKIKPGPTIGEAEGLVAAFCDRVLQLLEEDPRWKGLEMCDHGEESMMAFTAAAVSQKQVAEAVAHRKARDN